MNAVELSNSLRAVVVYLVAIGFPISRIAECLNVPEQSLHQYFSRELDSARTHTEVQARAALAHMAKSGRYPGVTQSLLKPPRPPQRAADPNDSPRGPILRPIDDTKWLEFNVYCNDGEPNADY